MIEPPGEGLPSWATASPRRVEHIRRVAGLAEGWAGEMGVPGIERARWLRAVWLHDALRDADEALLARWAAETPGPPELRHGPAAAARAEADGESDRGVLDAVRYHSVGYAGWDLVGQVLYCADYLEPGRGFAREHRAGLAARFPADPQAVLAAVARDRLTQLIQSGWPLLDTTVAFWNRLAVVPASR
ncbi:MAG TPA: HD domain-containing protein [Gemmatimonadales bacterium]|nr:HD domain-containing protein [Gemmatimonadales bacterium]